VFAASYFNILVLLLNKTNRAFSIVHIFQCIWLIFLMNNLTHFSQYIYFTPLHVSSIKCSSLGGSNCVNASSGVIHSSGWMSCVPTGTQDSHPLVCIIPDDVLTQFDPPDDEHLFLETCRGVK
jgi:hypothetical protein